MKKVCLMFLFCIFLFAACNKTTSVSTTMKKGTLNQSSTIKTTDLKKSTTIKRTDFIKINEKNFVTNDNDFLLTYLLVTESDLINFSFYNQVLKDFVKETNYPEYYLVLTNTGGYDYIWLYPTHRYDPNDPKCEILSSYIKIKSNLSFTFSTVIETFKDRFELNVDKDDLSILTLYNNSNDPFVNEFIPNKLLTFILEYEGSYYSLVYNDVTKELK